MRNLEAYSRGASGIPQRRNPNHSAPRATSLVVRPSILISHAHKPEAPAREWPLHQMLHTEYANRSGASSETLRATNDSKCVFLRKLESERTRLVGGLTEAANTGLMEAGNTVLSRRTNRNHRSRSAIAIELVQPARSPRTPRQNDVTLFATNVRTSVLLREFQANQETRGSDRRPASPAQNASEFVNRTIGSIAEGTEMREDKAGVEWGANARADPPSEKVNKRTELLDRE